MPLRQVGEVRLAVRGAALEDVGDVLVAEREQAPGGHVATSRRTSPTTRRSRSPVKNGMKKPNPTAVSFQSNACISRELCSIVFSTERILFSYSSAAPAGLSE